MPRRLGDLLARRAAEGFVGRDRELAAALELLEPGGPLVVQLHGPVGIGKSTLVERLRQRAAERGVDALGIDCRLVEPTERGFFGELGHLLGATIAGPADAALRFEGLSSTCLVVLDHYDELRLLDSWLRREFLPAMPGGVRVVLSGRTAPVPLWSTSPDWHGLFRSVHLEPLGTDAAHEILRLAGVTDPAVIRESVRIAHGNPLALKLAASAALDRPRAELGELAVHELFEQLIARFLDDVDEPGARDLLRATSIVRRVTRPLLEAIRPEAADAGWQLLERLPFVDRCRDGLRIHDALREAVAGVYRSQDPERHRDDRRRAWTKLREHLRDAAPDELWRSTADMLYLIENPTIREAFFASTEQDLAVDPARDADAATIREIVARHEGPRAAAGLDAWLVLQPAAFRVVRDREQRIVGFYCMCEAAELSPAVAARDEIAAAWVGHLEHEPLGESQRALLLRRWLAAETGEQPSAVQAACWLDIKRIYMELRPALRRVYLDVVDLETYAPVATELGFRPVDSIELDGARHHTAMLDFGPGSVDGWITGLVARELGIVERGLLDRDRRTMRLDGAEIALTPLEFGFFEYLEDRPGRVVTREELLAEVWDRRHTSGSNVIDVTVRALRRKMGRHGDRIETVRGFGYRLASG